MTKTEFGERQHLIWSNDMISRGADTNAQTAFSTSGTEKLQAEANGSALNLLIGLVKEKQQMTSIAHTLTVRGH